MITAIFRNLTNFNSASLTFSMSNFIHSYTNTRQSDALFSGIANAICRNNVQNFHGIAHGTRPGAPDASRPGFEINAGKVVYSWKYLHYDFKAFTRASHRAGRHPNYFIQVVDNNQLQDDSGDSGDNTDVEITDTRWLDLPPHRHHDGSSGVGSVYTTLQNLHERLNSLESSFNRQKATTAFRPRLE
jgi:hypothetical protein